MAKKQLKKEWYQIVAPKLFRNAVLGETFVFDPQHMIGKGISTNLMTLTNNSRNQNVKINFQVTKIEDNKGQAAIIGYELVPSSIKRLIRRNIEKIDSSFECQSVDNVAVRIKPLVIARSITSSSVARAMRKAVQETISNQAKSMKYDAFAADVIYHKLQDGLKKKLSKIYPVRICEIKYMGIVPEKKPESKEASKKEAQQEKAPLEKTAEEKEKIKESKQKIEQTEAGKAAPEKTSEEASQQK